MKTKECMCPNLLPGGSSLDEVEHGESVDNDELGSAGLAHALHDLDRKTNAVLVGPAPLVRALVRALRYELVDQIAVKQGEDIAERKKNVQ